MTNASNSVEINALQDIVETNKNAIEFYRSAQQKAKSPELRDTFTELAQLHDSTLQRVEGLLRERDANRQEEPTETIKGTATRVFGEVMAKMSSDVDKTLVSHLEEAEDRCLDQLKEASNKQEISPAVKEVITQELSNIRKSHGYMKNLKQRLAA